MVAAAAPASAGGWAVATLDPLTVPAAGEAAPVGFTVRQHGIHTVNVHELDWPTGDVPAEDLDVGITIRSSRGETTFFPAGQTGPTGHYVAEVVFPTAGQWSWSVEMGWFGTQELGVIDVAAAEATTTEASATPSPRIDPAGGYRWPLPVRLLLPAVAVGAVSLMVVDTLLPRRTPQVVSR